MQRFLLKLIFLMLPILASAQGFLHADGIYIYDGAGDEVILRGIGTGNWMIQEGYMMKTIDNAKIHTQWEFRKKLSETIGTEKTDSFYTAWLQYHMTRADIDSMKAWGFNSLRVAMHYYWFTPPIDDEPVQGEITWKETGFQMIDSLLDWCSDNEMYLILDMHATPGGQGTNADISDYDPDKDALWENQKNKDKLIALWKKLAERYSTEPWIGGYDLINETNWAFSTGNNNPLWNLFKDITAAIRTVDTNHIVILEGNWFANDYSGLPAIWDDNLVLSFHKYWTYNSDNSLDWMTNLRAQSNVPLWLGESGENSNTWFTSLVALAEKQHIGWSWWPVKKDGINNVFRVPSSAAYDSLINYYWAGNHAIDEDKAFAAVLDWAENHKIENCIVQHDVIDALIRQPFTVETKPFKHHTTTQTIFATEYDLGRNNHAYYDVDTATYHGDTDEYINWNTGWSFRNDGVDIEGCTDSETNGYDVGWTAGGEWLQYTIEADSTASYTLNIRYAGETGGKVRFEIDGVPASNDVTLTPSGSWTAWKTVQSANFIFPAGTHKLKLYSINGGANFNYLKLTNPVSQSSVNFTAFIGQVKESDTLLLILNKEITNDASEISISDFDIVSNGSAIAISGFKIDPENNRVLKIGIVNPVNHGDVIKISYSGTSIQNNGQTLQAFTDLAVINQLPVRYNIPGKIQAENYSVNNGLVFEDCTDAGGGQNSGYAAAGDYLDYRVNVTATDLYTINYRVAITASNAKLITLADYSGSFIALDTIQFASTGDWQDWETQSGLVDLPEGKYTLRLKILQGEQNLNWFEVIKYTATKSPELTDFQIFPNPANDNVTIKIPLAGYADYRCSIVDITGKQVLNEEFGSSTSINLNIGNLESGMYFVKLSTGNSVISYKKLVKN
jgi:endoglucanase